MRLGITAITLVALGVSAGALRADTIVAAGQSFDGTVLGIHNGKVAIRADGVEKQFDFEKVTIIDVAGTERLFAAEQARDDAKKAAALYKQAIPTINKAELKLLAEWRAIGPTEQDGRWSEALALFLDVYKNEPAESVWKTRPQRWPAAGSEMLNQGAELVAKAIKETKSDDAQKNLRAYLVDIYNHADRKDDAARLAREIATGIPDTGEHAETLPPPAGLTAIDAALQKKDFANVVSAVDALLATGISGEPAARAFTFKAQALEGLDKTDDAIAAWLRIPAHYPSSTQAPVALMRAAELEIKLERKDQAAALLREIQENYPESSQAASLKK